MVEASAKLFGGGRRSFLCGQRMNAINCISVVREKGDKKNPKYP